MVAYGKGTKGSDKQKGRKYRVRFHLGQGKNFMDWQISHPSPNDSTKRIVKYVKPSSGQIVMRDCRLKNNEKTASKIFNKEIDKTPIAWVECNKVEVLKKPKYTNESMPILYNPRVAVNWKDADGNILDNYNFPILVTINKKIYFPAEDGNLYELGGVSDYEVGGSLNEKKMKDLFEDYTNIPPAVQDILDKYPDAFEDGNYSDLEKALKELESIGYTFDYGLDGVAYGLRPIDIPINSLEGYEDFDITEKYSVGDIFQGSTNSLYEQTWELFKPRKSYVLDKKTNEIISIHETPDEAITAKNKLEKRKGKANNYKLHFEKLKMATGGILNESQEEQFQEWMADGNVHKFSDGYGTQDALYRNRLKTLDDLRRYFYNEFLKDSYAQGGNIVEETMREFKQGKLRSSSGKIVTDRKQAIAIALSKKRRNKYAFGGGVDEEKFIYEDIQYPESRTILYEDELDEFIDEWNEMMNTDYDNWKEFNKGEKYYRLSPENKKYEHGGVSDYDDYGDSPVKANLGLALLGSQYLQQRQQAKAMQPYRRSRWEDRGLDYARPPYMPPQPMPVAPMPQYPNNPMNQELMNEMMMSEKYEHGGMPNMNDAVYTGFSNYHRIRFDYEEAKEYADNLKSQYPNWDVIVTEENNTYYILVRKPINMGKRVYADGGALDGKRVRFKHWSGDIKSGIVLGMSRDGKGYDVQYGTGHVFVRPNEVVEIYQRGGYPTGRAWSKEHYNDNDDEDYEVDPKDRHRKHRARNRYARGGFTPNGHVVVIFNSVPHYFAAQYVDNKLEDVDFASSDDYNDLRRFIDAEFNSWIEYAPKEYEEMYYGFDAIYSKAGAIDQAIENIELDLLEKYNQLEKRPIIDLDRDESNLSEAFYKKGGSIFKAFDDFGKWFFGSRKSYPVGRAWTREHYHDNDDEDYEVDPRKRKVKARNRKYAGGGGVDKYDYDYEDIGQFSMSESEWKNYSPEDFNKIGRQIVREQFDGNLDLAYDTIVRKKYATGGNVRKNKWVVEKYETAWDDIYYLKNGKKEVRIGDIKSFSKKEAEKLAEALNNNPSTTKSVSFFLKKYMMSDSIDKFYFIAGAFKGYEKKRIEPNEYIVYDLETIIAEYLGSFKKGFESVKMYKTGGQVHTPHYVVNNEIFVDYMDAIEYCDKNNLSYELIQKTKKYANGGFSGYTEEQAREELERIARAGKITLSIGNHGLIFMQILSGNNFMRSYRTYNEALKDYDNYVFNYGTNPNYKFADGGKLIGDQYKIDMNKNGRIDAEDFKILRSSMNGAWRNEHKHVNHGEGYEKSYARTKNPSRTGYKGRKEYALGGAINDRELEQIGSDYAYVTSSDYDRAVYRLLDSDYTDTLLPKYIQTIKEWEQKHNTPVRANGKMYVELYPEYALGGKLDSETFDSLKKGDMVTITFDSPIQKNNQKQLKVTSKTIVGKGKSFESEKITLVNPDNPTGVKYFIYRRKSGQVSFAIGDMATSNVAVEKMAKGGKTKAKTSSAKLMGKGSRSKNQYNKEVDDYKWFVVSDNKDIDSGFEYKNDATDQAKELNESEYKGCKWKVMSLVALKRQGIDDPRENWKYKAGLGAFILGAGIGAVVGNEVAKSGATKTATKIKTKAKGVKKKISADFYEFKKASSKKKK